MAIDFPTGVPAGTEFTSAGVTWEWDGQKWVSQATGGGGGGSGMPTGGGTPPEDAFYENTTVIDEDYQITDGRNAGTFGPVTVNGDITVPDGSVWTVVGGGEGGGGGGGGGVTSIIAGEGISVDQPTGAVTITNTGGGGDATPGVRYQQGTWDLTWTGDGASISLGTPLWTRVGDQVTCYVDLQFPVTSNTAPQIIGNLPYPHNGNKLFGKSIRVDNDKVPGGFTLEQTGDGNLMSVGSNAEQNVSLTRQECSGVFTGFLISYITNDTTFAPSGTNSSVTEDTQGIGGGGATGVRYQDGEWTPTFTGGGTDRGSVFRWSRNGNLVTIWSDWTWDTVPTDANIFTMGGLPYAAQMWAAGSMYMQQKGGETVWVPFVLKDETNIQIKAPSTTSNVANTDDVKNEYFVGGYNNIQVSYITADTTFVPQNSATVITDIQGGGGSGGGSGSGADAWASFDGDGATGAKTINASFNIASVNKTGTGTYDVVFTTPMGSSEYAVTSSYVTSTSNKTAAGFTILTYNSSGASTDLGDVQFAVNAANAIAPQSGVGADAWGEVSGGGVLQSGFNATVSKVDSGIYAITFTTPMPSSSYAAQATCIRPTNAIATINDMSKTGFQVRTRTDAGTLFDSAFSFTVHASSTITPTFTWTRNGILLEPANAGDDIILKDGDYGTFQITTRGNAGLEQMSVYNASGDNTVAITSMGTVDFYNPITGNDYMFRLFSNQSGSKTEVFKFETHGNAFKPGGGSWNSLSDARSKNSITPYTSGLAELSQIETVRYKYNGSDQEYVGVLAQQVENVMPELVSVAPGTTYDGQEIQDLRSVDQTPLTFALINAVKEMATRIEALEARITTLEGGSN